MQKRGIPNGEGEDAKVVADLVEGGTSRLELQVVVLVNVAREDSGLHGALAAGTVSRTDQDVEGVSFIGDKDKVLNRAVLLIGDVHDHLLRGNDVTLDLVRGGSGDRAAVEEGSGLGNRLLDLNVVVANLHQTESSLGSEVGSADDIGSASLNGGSGVGVDDSGVAVSSHVTINMSSQFTIRL